ncbi:MAG: class II glutamine amidotransferase [candidate division Zixibacteria bacterium]|nr:class II glutamine amidotransferase [candidate division Zixibacteria bacterium]
MFDLIAKYCLADNGRMLHAHTYYDSMLRLFHYIKLIGAVFLVAYPLANSNINAESLPDCQAQMSPALDYSGFEHNCRLWAVISDSITDSVIYNQLIAYPRSLKNLSMNINIDGWGIAYYPCFGDSLYIDRGAMRAFDDPNYDFTVARIDSLKPNIILAHIRNCTSGCCCHGCESIPNPHPFRRCKNNRNWVFAHNGRVDEALLYDLIGDEYLDENPLNGSDIPECDPADSSLVIDSELYFLYLLKRIENNDWNAASGIINALTDLVYTTAGGYYNFILSDGYTIWAYHKGNLLYYFYDNENNFCAAASIYPSGEQEQWQEVSNYGLVVLTADEEPVLINPHYVPGDINGDKRLLGSDITYGVRYFNGTGTPPPDSCHNDSTGTWLYAAGDANGNCEFIGSDIIYLARYFLSNNPPPCWCPQTPLYNEAY